MKMEVLAVQSTYGTLGSNKVRDWTRTLTPPTSAVVATNAKNISSNNNNNSNSNSNKNKSSINRNGSTSSSSSNSSLNSINSNKSNKKPKHHHAVSYHSATAAAVNSAAPYTYANHHNNISNNNNNKLNNFYCDESSDIDAAAVDELSLRLLDELRAAKSRHLTCTEVSLPCDLTPSIAAEIIRVSSKEPCGIRGCTIYIEFEDEPNNSRRIATLKLDPETVSTFEVYLTLRQDHRGWTALLPQFMKSLARTITISPVFTITKNKLYSTDCEGLSSRRSYSFGSSAAIATPTTTTTAT